MKRSIGIVDDEDIIRNIERKVNKTSAGRRTDIISENSIRLERNRALLLAHKVYIFSESYLIGVNR
jgi:hypothetical protein